MAKVSVDIYLENYLDGIMAHDHITNQALDEMSSHKESIMKGFTWR